MEIEKQVKELNKQLYPTGRVWQYVKGSEQSQTTVTRFVDGLGNPFVDGFGNAFIQTFGTEASPSKRLINAFLKSYERAYSDSLSILNQRLADNDEFDITDASNWERVFGLNGGSLTLEERKANILRRQAYPSGVAERGNYLLIQDELQKAGFDVYLTENRFANGTDWEVINPDDDVENFNRLNTLNSWTILFMKFIEFNTAISNYTVEFKARIATNYPTNDLGSIGVVTPYIDVSPIEETWNNYSFDFTSSDTTIRIGIYNAGSSRINEGTDIQIKDFRIVDTATKETVYVPDSIINNANWDVKTMNALEYSICANYIEENIDNAFYDNIVSQSEMGKGVMGISTMERLEMPPTDEQLRSTFFIGGSSFPSIANVPLSRKNEFRQLILKLKPAQTLAYLYINYV